jgi:hypothetical protein
VHLRRALERAGILATLDALDVSPKGYKGAHYAVWPPELVRLLIAEMCPRRVCAVCGQPSRRVSVVDYEATTTRTNGSKAAQAVSDGVSSGHHAHRATNPVRTVTAPTWTDCGHDAWQPGLVLDPFVGSGTTLAVCSGMGRDSIGIDLDYTNVGLAHERVGGLFLDVEWPEGDLTLPALPAGGRPATYEPWAPMLGHRGRARAVALPVDHLPCPRRAPTPPPARPAPRPQRRTAQAGAGQLDLLTHEG